MARHRPRRLAEPILDGLWALRAADPYDRAAVSLILRERAADGGLDILLIQRATVTGDPWSGHMALPGGRYEPGEHFAWQVAARETAEEVGLHLPISSLLGTLGPSWTGRRARGRRMHRLLAVTPAVFLLVPSPVATPLVTNHEVAAAGWVDVGRFADPAARTTRTWRPFKGLPLAFDAPAVSLPRSKDPKDAHLNVPVWGLTLGFLRRLLAVTEGQF